MSSLFDPVQAGDLQLSNRIVMAPLTRNRAPNAVPRDITATYYAQRASAGLLITERSIHDEPRIPSPPADSQVVALPGAPGAGWRVPARPH